MIRMIAVAVLGAAAGVALLGLVPPLSLDVGAGQVEISARLQLDGETEVQVPPLGDLEAETHSTPVGLEVALESIDVAQLGTVITDRDAVVTARSGIIAELRRGTRRFFTRAVLLAGVAGAVVGLILPGRRWRHALVAAGAAAGALVVLLTATWNTFDAAALEHPRFSGVLTRAPQFFAALERHVGGMDELEDHLERMTERMAELDSLIRPGPRPEAESLILHVSDIHSNPIGLQLARHLAVAFDVDAVLDTGDLTSFGSPLEPRLLAVADELPVPYLFVPGNHDSPQNRRLIEATPGITLLDGETANVAGVEILGIADPSYTADGSTTASQANALRRASAPRVLERVRALRPDVLAVHSKVQARSAFGTVPLVVAGHLHRGSSEVEQGTVVLTVGSTGATGLGSLLGAEPAAPYEAELLRLVDGRPQGIKYITVDNLEGGFQVDNRAVPSSAEGN